MRTKRQVSHRPWVVAAVVAVIVTVCGSAPVARSAGQPPAEGSVEPAGASSIPSAEDPDAVRCLVRLHGKSGSGGETTVDDEGVTNILPNGNAEGWGGRQWLYFPDDDYDSARQIVVDATADCDVIILNGFSNGAAFAAKLYCRGETFDGRLLRVVVDDPVPDAGVLECEPDADVEVVLYWTGGIEETAQPGWDCGEGDWTCEGGETIGIGAYAEALGVDVQESPFDEHEWYWEAPELTVWSPLDDNRPLDDNTDSTEPSD